MLILTMFESFKNGFKVKSTFISPLVKLYLLLAVENIYTSVTWKMSIFKLIPLKINLCRIYLRH